jgi:hypothetical protein
MPANIWLKCSSADLARRLGAKPAPTVERGKWPLPVRMPNSISVQAATGPWQTGFELLNWPIVPEDAR